MAISVLFNGVTYSIPETGEESWGENLTSYFTAIPQGALQKTGGTFTLTADVNFGATYGVLSKYLSTRTALPSTVGLVRLAVSDSIGWRNNANSANLLLAVNGSDQLTFNGTAIYPAGITALTGDVTATGPGSVAATVAKIQGTTVSGTTGSGNVVFSTSATLVTPALGTPSALVGTNISGTAASLTAGLATSLVGGLGGSIPYQSSVNTTAMLANGSASQVLTSQGTTLAPAWALIVNANISSSAAIAFSKLATLSSTNILVGSAGNVATAVAMSGDVTIGNTGVTAIGSGKVTNAMLATAASAATASYVVLRDANANILTNSFIAGFRTQATANGTLALVVGDAQQQTFTGTTAGQIVTLPTTSIIAGQSFQLVNLSSQSITVNSSGGNLVQTMAASSVVTVTAVVATPTTAANWTPVYSTQAAGGGSVTSVAASGPSGIATWSSAITTSGTLTQTLSTQSARTFFQGPASGSAAAPTFAALTSPTIQKFTASPTGATNYAFTITSGNTASVGAVYTNNGQSFTLLAALLVGDTILYCSGTGTPAASGTLTYSSGTHTGGNITFSAFLGCYVLPTGTTPLYIRVEMVGPGGGGAGSSTSGSDTHSGSAGSAATTFGTSLLSAGAGNGGGSINGNSPGGTGGTSSLGSGPIGLASTGASGNSGGGSATSGVFFGGPSGGATVFGGTAGGPYNQGAPAVTANTGCGGGAAGGPTGGWVGGGGGAGGLVNAVISSPSSFYSYSIGTGGSKGTAGTSGQAGADGSAGFIKITEFYQ